MSQEKPEIRQQMTDEDLEAALRVAVPETVERVSQQLAGLAGPDALLRRWFEEHFPAPELEVKDIREAIGLGWELRPDGRSLTAFVNGHRAETARQVMRLGRDFISTGRAAAAVGLPAFGRWPRTDLVERPPWLRPRFDAATWYRAVHEILSLDDVGALLRRLGYLYPGVLGLEPPDPRFLDRSLKRPATPRYGVFSKSEIEAAARRASERPAARLCGDGKGLPGKLPEILEYASGHLLDYGLRVVSCCEALGIRDRSVSTQVLFHRGETLPQLVARRRIETALDLLRDPRFPIPRIVEELRMGDNSFRRELKQRTGATARAIGETAAATAGLDASILWHQAESGELTAAQVEWLAGFLRGLQPAAFERSRPILAVRRDVDADDVEAALELRRAAPSGVIKSLRRVFFSHPDGSAARWYAGWVRDRLGRADPAFAWTEWQAANRRLKALLERPREGQLAGVRHDPDCQTDAFLWLLADCVGARLFHDAGESEHFADLAVAAVEGRQKSKGSPPVVAGMRALVAALKANAVRRRNELEEASERFGVVFGILEDCEVDPWIEGRVKSLYASLLNRKGEEEEAFRILEQAAGLFKDADDELEWVRCVMDSCSGRFAKGEDPSGMLTECVAVLERYPFATDVRSTAHVNRIVSSIYLTDQLTGRHLATIKSLRAAMPLAGSAFAAAQYDIVDGLIAALEDKLELAAAILQRSAACFEEHELLAEAAVGWLLYSWAVLVVDGPAAARAAKTAYVYMERTGFRSQGLQKVALRIYQDARQGELSRGLLRHCILLTVCPGMEARLESEAEPLHAVAISRSNP